MYSQLHGNVTVGLSFMNFRILCELQMIDLMLGFLLNFTLNATNVFWGKRCAIRDIAVETNFLELKVRLNGIFR